MTTAVPGDGGLDDGVAPSGLTPQDAVPSGLTPEDVTPVLVARAPDAVAQDVDGETVVFVPGGGHMMVLDPVATRVWVALETPLLLTALCERLAAEFDVPVAQIAADLIDPYEVLVTGGAIVATVQE